MGILARIFYSCSFCNTTSLLNVTLCVVGGVIRVGEELHFDQQRKMGFGLFNGRKAREYLKFGINNFYGTPGTLENQADRYAQRLLEYEF